MPLSKRTTISEVIGTTVKSLMSDTYHCLPGIVQAYYPADLTADIQIAVKDPRFDPDTDVLQTEQWPLYPHVRVAWPNFGGFIISGQLNKLDAVQVFFQDLDDSAYRESGQVSDPPRTRRHGSDAAFCFPMSVLDVDATGTDANTAGVTIIGTDGSQAQIRFDGTHIQLGATGSDFIALASLVASELGKIKAAIAGLSCASAPGPVVSSAPYTAVGNVASSRIKAQ